MPIFIKKSGAEIIINDLPATLEKAKELGWKLKPEFKEEAPKETKKVTKKTKA